ncbi:unnamed protein product [Closterium sp. NIES-54]
MVGRKTTIRLSIPDKAGFREGNETVVYHLYLRGVKDELQHLLNFKRVFREGPLYVLDLGFESQVGGSHCAVLCGAVLCGAVLCGAVLYWVSPQTFFLLPPSLPPSLSPPQIFNTFGAFTSVGYVGIQFALQMVPTTADASRFVSHSCFSSLVFPFLFPIPQKCHHIDLYGLFLSERHGVRHHYYNRDEYMPAHVTSEQLDREFVQSIEIADAELMWIADPCLYGE